jgi:putative ubiquitin-RnfH superfamily antitoxin RatB of RatAB toxin-antitoxin module
MASAARPSIVAVRGDGLPRFARSDGVFFLAMNITVIYAPAQRLAQEWLLALPEGSTVQQALEQSGVQAIFSDIPELLARGDLFLGIWGRACSADQVLIEDARVEIYRPLRVDPKVARRERFNGQGVKRAGLFAKKRDGAKAGY